ncbi:S41 family peptidase [Maribellus mangrovi]|uniref:S41 family peptidase n=1 Tax=Maribellus mangrovi TaxID=3133146 RepID=UPI0030EDDCF4
MKSIFSFLALLIFSLNAFSQELSNDAWLDDLQIYKRGLEQKHINGFNKISKTDFNAALEQIKATLGEKSDLETIIDLMRLTRKIGDGHTAISLRNQETHNYPIELKNFNGDWKVVKVCKNDSDLLGMKLTGIDELGMQEVVGKVENVAQFVENEYSKIIRTAQYITSSEVLFGLGICGNKTSGTFRFEDEYCVQTTRSFTALSEAENEEVFSEISIGAPEIQVPGNPEFEHFWYAPIEGTDALYIHFESYPAFEEMMKISEEIVAYIFQNNIRQLVIDMRNNGGGDLYVGLVLANALNLADPVDWKSGVYVLCDNVTFSAATSNTALFRELLNAKIVGEPTGSNPTGYQDMDTFELPNSKLVVCYSKRLFRIQEVATQGVQPDIPIKYEWESYSQGKDNMLEWVIGEIRE